MQKLKNLLTKLLQWALQYVDPTYEPFWHIDVLEKCQDLITTANAMASDTTGPYKRQWAMHRLKKAFPNYSSSFLAMHLEYQLEQGK